MAINANHVHMLLSLLYVLQGMKGAPQYRALNAFYPIAEMELPADIIVLIKRYGWRIPLAICGNCPDG